MATPHVVGDRRADHRQRRARPPPDAGTDHRPPARDRAQARRPGRRTPVRGGPARRGRGDRPGGPGAAERQPEMPMPHVPMARSARRACDLAIVGGGIVGLAVARELIRRRPQASVCVLERESELGTHQTGHNSGVIHAGVYYEPGSLKARLCVEGAREMYALLRGAGHRPRALRQGDRRDRLLRARAPGGARAPGQGQRCARPAPDRRRRHRRDRAARAWDRGTALARHRHR